MEENILEHKELILQLSENQENIHVALKEWYYTGECEELEEADGVCQLCSKTGLRYYFTIENQYNQNQMDVGSECIKRFSIDVLHDGNLLSGEDAKKKVNRDRSQLIKESNYQSVLRSLTLLAEKDHELNIESFHKYYKEHQAFTPKQLATIIWRLDEFNIPYQKSRFKMKMRRDKERHDFFQLEEWRFNQIKKCLSQSQIDRYYEEQKKP